MALWELAPCETRSAAVQLLDRMAIEHGQSADEWENADPVRYSDGVSAFLADARRSRWDVRVVHRELTDDVWERVSRFLGIELAGSFESVPSLLRSLCSNLPDDLSNDEVWLLTNALLAGMVYE